MKNVKYVVYIPDARGFYAGLIPAASDCGRIRIKTVSDPDVATAADTEEAIASLVTGELTATGIPVPPSHIMAFGAPESIP